MRNISHEDYVIIKKAFDLATDISNVYGEDEEKYDSYITRLLLVPELILSDKYKYSSAMNSSHDCKELIECYNYAVGDDVYAVESLSRRGYVENGSILPTTDETETPPVWVAVKGKVVDVDTDIFSVAVGFTELHYAKVIIRVQLNKDILGETLREYSLYNIDGGLYPANRIGSAEIAHASGCLHIIK